MKGSIKEQLLELGLCPPDDSEEFVLERMERMSTRDKVRALSDPANWVRFVRRTGQHDQAIIDVDGLKYQVVFLSEKRYLIFLLGSSDFQVTGNLEYLGLRTSQTIPRFYRLQEKLVDALAELLLPSWNLGKSTASSASDVPKVASGKGGRGRAHWRKLHGESWKAHSSPPAELIDIGVPATKPGMTFVNEARSA